MRKKVLAETPRRCQHGGESSTPGDHKGIERWVPCSRG
jgi:hypothetical protein